MAETTKKPTIHEQLLAVQEEIEVAQKDTNNPYFKSKYADYNSIMGVAKEPLNKNELYIKHVGRYENGEYGIDTIIANKTGEFVNCFVPVLVKEAGNAQAQGSSITYARRYGLSLVLAIQTEDDDGNTASTKGIATQKPPQDEAPAYEEYDDYGMQNAEVCPKCGSNLKVVSGISSKTGKPYKFTGCSAYPTCNYVKK